MAGRFALIVKRTPWSLLAKAALAGLSWFFLPWWLFALLALVLYFIPFFRPSVLALPFSIMLLFSYFLPHSLLAATLLAVLSFLLLGVKDLILINRASAYEAATYLLFFCGFWLFFSSVRSFEGPFATLGMTLVGMFVFFMLRGLLRYLGGAAGSAPEVRRLPGSLLVSFLLLELCGVILFLPLSQLTQTAVLFLFGVLLLEILLDYLREELTRERILLHFSIVFIAVAVLLAAAPWQL